MRSAVRSSRSGFAAWTRTRSAAFSMRWPTTWPGSTQQITTLTQDNAGCAVSWIAFKTSWSRQGELQRAQVNPQEQVTDQAVLLLDQAQQLADALIDEGMQSARDMLIAARTHQRDIVDPSVEIDHGARSWPWRRAEHAIRPGGPGVLQRSRTSGCSPKVAQVQFRAVLDALNEQVNRLGQVSEGGEERSWAPQAGRYDRSGHRCQPSPPDVG